MRESDCEPMARKCKLRISSAVKLTLANFGKVPIAVSRESQDRSFADMVRGAKADLQIAGPFSLTQLAPVQIFLISQFVQVKDFG